MKPTTTFILLFTLIVVAAGTAQFMIDNRTGDNMSNTVVFETTKGDFTIELNEDEAPITVANFKKYVQDGFYDGTVFHRVIEGFMIQGGGFTQNGTEKETRPPIELEVDTGLKNRKGTIAMARTTDPHSATSQFFINTVDNPMLDPNPSSEGYAVFGKVTSGMEVIKEIEDANTSKKGYHDDWPVEDIVINKVYFKE